MNSDKFAVQILGDKLDGVHQLSEPVTLEESAYKEMRRVIMDGTLQPGERISVHAMAQRLGVSRLPVIHALRRLASEGFIQIRPHKSPIVTKPTAKEIRVRCLMMIALEGIAVNQAWPMAPAHLAEMEKHLKRSSQEIRAGINDVDADWRFHEVVWRASGVEQLRFTIQTLWDQGAYYRSLALRVNGLTLSRIQAHEGILEALRSGTPEEAVERIRAHRLSALERMLAAFGGTQADLPEAIDAPDLAVNA